MASQGFILRLGWALLGVSGLVALPLRAQTPAEPPTYQKCATVEADSALRRRFPSLGSGLELERQLRDKIAEVQRNAASGRTAADVITIPIVVHIVHNGETPGTGANLSAAQVASQLAVLNEDFRRTPNSRGFNNNAAGADVEIDFCLAQVDPRGVRMAEPGIDRYNGGKAVWERDDIENTLKPSTFWEPEKYFNVWVVPRLGSTASGGTLLGYAQFPVQSGLTGLPATGAATTDGVVIFAQAFGSNDKGAFPVNAAFGKGRTLTHEVGHWLGLRHIWGDAQPNCGDDFVSDTPPANGSTSGCPVGRTTCGGVNQIENYMDYTDDVCMNLFTQGQKARMRAVMQISPRRVGLLTSTVCGTQVAAAPRANFTADRREVLRGATVTFTDLSANLPTSYRWTFVGGKPRTSTARSPTVVYDTSGVFRVSLTVRNDKGADSLRREGYVAVSTQGICGQVTNFGSGTRTVLRAPASGGITRGYVAGHNNLLHSAKAEYFANELGYVEVSAALVRFGVARSASPTATVRVTAWNARGVQGSPGAVLETKLVPLALLQPDIARNQPTRVVFDRSVPLFGRPFYLGVELLYAPGDTVALVTTRDGEATQSTAWERLANGTWQSYAVGRGQNVAHDLAAVIGLNPSVQVAGSASFITAGEAVTLNARGASVFAWSPGAGLSTALGPQVVARPLVTTTYTVTGSGLELCNNSASFTVFVSGGPVTALPVPVPTDNTLTVYPNPGAGVFAVQWRVGGVGRVQTGVYDLTGRLLRQEDTPKTTPDFVQTIDLSAFPPGTYLLRLSLRGTTAYQRVVKY